MTITYDPAPVLARYRDLTDGELGEILGVTRECVNRWRNGRSRLYANLADEIAVVRLGKHPSELWPDTWGYPDQEAS